MNYYMILPAITMIGTLVLAYKNWRSANDPKADRNLRWTFCIALLALILLSDFNCKGQSVYVGYSQRFDATVAINTDECSATITTPTDTIVLYGDTVTYFRDLVILKEHVSEGFRMLAQICTSGRCAEHPTVAWCRYCGNQRNSIWNRH